MKEPGLSAIRKPRSSSLSSLYISYLALSDPLVETQVVAYLEGLAHLGHRIHLLTFETRRLKRADHDATAARLARRGIMWHSLRYHKRPSLPVTAYDTVRGAIKAGRLVNEHNLDVIHARSHVPAAMAIIARRLTGCGIVFDIRGLMAEEYVDAGRWKHKSLPWKITKWVERIAIESSDACVVLTPAARDMLFGKSPSTHVAVIPCCADLDRLRSGMSQRERMRDALGLHDKTVAVYVGKFGGWYLQREMVEFVAAAQNEIEGLHFLVVTQDAPAMIESYLEGAKIDRSAYTITEVPPARMGAVLAASDFGLSFIAPLPSKVASSPTKLGEYLGAGIPVVFTAGAGHLDEPMVHLRAGVMLSELSRAGYRQAAIEIKTLINDPETPRRSIAVAKSNLSLQDLGIPRYDGLYGEVARLRQV